MSVRQSMSILLALETSGGGSGRHVLDLAEELGQRDHRVIIAYSPLRAETSFLQELQALTDRKVAEARAIHMRRQPCLEDMASLAAMRRLILEHGPFDILHGHSSKAGTLLRMMPRSAGARVYTPHALRITDPTLHGPRKIIYASIEAALGRCRTEAIVAVSPSEAEVCKRMGIPSEKIHVVVNGVKANKPDESHASRASVGLPERALVFGFVGRFAPQKAPLRLIRSFATVNRERPDARLVMVGDGPEKPKAEQLVSQLGLTEKVFFTGAAPARHYFPIFDVFVMPSLYEAMPYVLLEAAAFHCPIICTAVSGAEVVVRSGINGRIVPNNDESTGLALAMLEASDPETHQRWTRAAGTQITLPTVSDMTTMTEDVYVNALKL